MITRDAQYERLRQQVGRRQWYNWLGIKGPFLSEEWRPSDGPPAIGWDITPFLLYCGLAAGCVVVWALIV